MIKVTFELTSISRRGEMAIELKGGKGKLQEKNLWQIRYIGRQFRNKKKF
jgi:hypothetical protein